MIQWTIQVNGPYCCWSIRHESLSLSVDNPWWLVASFWILAMHGDVFFPLSIKACLWIHEHLSMNSYWWDEQVLFMDVENPPEMGRSLHVTHGNLSEFFFGGTSHRNDLKWLKLKQWTWARFDIGPTGSSRNQQNGMVHGTNIATCRIGWWSNPRETGYQVSRNFLFFVWLFSQLSWLLWDMNSDIFSASDESDGLR